jgi:hypothetical protein
MVVVTMIGLYVIALCRFSCASPCCRHDVSQIYHSQDRSIQSDRSGRACGIPRAVKA